LSFSSPHALTIEPQMAADFGTVAVALAWLLARRQRD